MTVTPTKNNPRTPQEPGAYARFPLHQDRAAKVPSRRIILLATALLALSGCIRSFGGPNDNAPERFEFIGIPVAVNQAEPAFESMMGPQFEQIVPGTFDAIGRFPGARTDRFLAEFQVNDPQLGLSQCSGLAGDGGGSLGCGPVDQEQIPNDLPVAFAGSGTDSTWSEAEFVVSDEVAYLVATADDGTNYRMEPIGGHAWMEWRSSHGEITVTAYDADDAKLDTISADSPR